MTTPAPDPPSGKVRDVKPFTAASIVAALTAGGLASLQLFSGDKDNAGFFGTVSSWFSAGGIMGILTFLGWLQLGNRKIAVDQTIAENADKADIRDAYAGFVRQLQEERAQMTAAHQAALAEMEGRYRANIGEVETHYQRALKTAEERHAECEKQREVIRDELRQVKTEFEGFKDQWRAAQSDRVLAMERRGDQPSEAVVDSAKRVKRIAEDKAGGDSDAGK